MNTFNMWLIVALLLSVSGCGDSSEGDAHSGAKVEPQFEEVVETPVAIEVPIKDIEEKLSAEIEWDIPTIRQNGDELLLSEIGGYEVKYRNTNHDTYETVIIKEQTIDKYIIENIEPGEYEVLIATFDTDGQYSDFSEPVITDFSQLSRGI